MNPGETVPADPETPPLETTRQFISDLTVQVLADAYGYTVTLPSTLDTAHATLDSLGGTLLVQGLSGNDTIDISTTGTGGDTIEVAVNSTTETFATGDVNQIIIARNGGSDSVTVASTLQAISQEVDFVVSSNEDEIDSGSLTDEFVDLDSVVPGNQVTLRAAILEANGNSGASSIYVPRLPGDYVLSRSGSESGGAVGAENDLEITTEVTILGAGAGLTVIDASGLQGVGNAVNDRVFSVLTGASSGASTNGDLTLSGVTLTGGDVDTLTGGAILVDSTLHLTDSALIGNKARQGGAIRVTGSSANVTIQRSVFTENTATQQGGAIYSGDNNSVMSISSSIFANNSATSAYDNVRSEGNSSSDGTNLSDKNDPIFSNNGDHVGSVDYVVTTVADVIDSTDDDLRLSLREAMIAANGNAGAEEIWLPGWDFILGLEAGAGPDMTADQGDLDVSESLTVRGVGDGTDPITSIRWNSTVMDEVFQLIGDYNGDGSVDSGDYTFWLWTLGQTGPDLPADGDDDGDVDQQDYDVWASHFGNTLTLVDVEVG